MKWEWGTKHYESTKHNIWNQERKRNDIRKMTNTNELRWKNYWKRTEEKNHGWRTNELWNKITKELEDWNETRITKKETGDEEIRQRIWKWWERDSKRMTETNRNKLREWERIEKRKKPKHKQKENVAYKQN